MIILVRFWRKNTFLTWCISFVIGLGLFSGLGATSSYDITTIAGNGTAGFGGDNGQATSTSAMLNGPKGVFLDNSNNIYFTDAGTHHVRKIAANGVITTIAGTGTAGFSGDGGSATAATFNSLFGIAVDNTTGDVYVTDAINNRIRKIAANGIVTTIAGASTGPNAGYSGDGSAATGALLSNPGGVCRDSTGNIYFADTANNCIRQITTAGIISTLSGLTLNAPKGICVDGLNNLFVANTGGNNILKRTSTGAVSTLSAFTGLAAPQGIFVDGFNNIFVANTGGNNIKMLWGATTSGSGAGQYAQNSVYTIASSISAGANDPTTPIGIWVVGSTTPNLIRVYFGDSQGIKYFNPSSASNANPLASITKIFTSSAGSNSVGLFGVANTAANIDTVYYSHSTNYVKNFTWNYSSNAAVGLTIIAGTGTAGFSGDGAVATSAQLSNPYGIFVNGSTVYVADSGNNRIRSFTVGGPISTIAGTGYSGDGGPATSALLNNPNGICIDSTTSPITIYFTDSVNNVVRKISNGTISTIAGQNSSGATILTALNAPKGICLDSARNIYIADTVNNLIRKIPAAGGSISTIAGGGADASLTYSGSPTGASLSLPTGVYVDNAGNVYIADSGRNIIRKISGGVMSTIAGSAGGSTVPTYSGAATSASLSNSRGIHVDNAGNVYIADQGRNVIRKLLSKLAFSVAPGSSQTLSGTAATAYIQGGGTAVLPPSNSISAVEVSNGILQVSTPAPITFNASGGSALVEITANTRTGAYIFTTPGTVKIGTDIAVTLDAPSGGSLMSKTGAGRLQAVENLSSSTTPIAVSEGILEVSGPGRLPNAATSVASGATLQLGTASGSVVAGAVANASVASGGIMSILAGATGAVTSADISSGGIVSVAAGVTAPDGMFSSATFHSGGILQLGDGATLAQSFISEA